MGIDNYANIANGTLGINGGEVEDVYWERDSLKMKNILGSDIAIDGLFFNWTELKKKDIWKLYPYAFCIHNGEKPIKILNMPLGPQSISISVPAAVSTTVTMRGITEEHNDAPLRQITITGTTGINPGFNGVQSGGKSAGSSALEYMFANTIQAAGKFKDIANQLESSISGFNSGRKLKSPLIDSGDLTSGDGLQNSAYQTIHNMTRFFDMYLAAKKQGAKALFFSFYMYKDRMYYDCTLNNYSIRKVAGSMEYQYTISLTAWRRRKKPVGEGFPDSIHRTSASKDANQNPFAAINNSLSLGINLINSAGNVLKGFSQDYDTVLLSPVKKVGLLMKSMLGLATTLADFPNALSQQGKNAMKSSFRFLENSGQDQTKMSALNKSIKDKGGLHSPSPDGQPNAYASNVIPNSVSKDEASTSADDSPEKSEETSDPFEKIFQNPQEFSDVFSFFSLEELNLSSALSDAIQDEIDKALALTADDVRSIKDGVENFVSSYSESLGGGSETYNRSVGKGPVKQASKTLSVDDINTLSIFNDVLQALDSVTVLLDERQKSKTSDTDYAAYFAEQAISYGIDFAQNTSKFYVPFEYDSSLERMAVKYLGDAGRWIEIAAINALKAPYIDEIGFYIDLKASGAGNSFSVSSVSNLYIGQIVELSSDTQRPEPRQITAIDVVSSVEAIITVKGEADLARFTIAANAKLKAFLPNTINSNQLIAIPSASAINIPGNMRINPDKEDLTLITLTAKADFMLNFDKQNTADIAFTGADVKIARGMTNIIQAANIKVLTPRGDLLQDPTFGNPVKIGSSTADIDVADTLTQLSSMYEQDPRFHNIIAGRVVLKTNALIVDMVLGVQNSQAYLPFTVSIPIGK